MNNFSSNYIQYPFQVTPTEILGHLAVGRKDHCFKSYWAGSERIFTLTGFDSINGIVYFIGSGGTPGTVHHTDMIGLFYLGLTCNTLPWPPTPPPGCRWIPVADGGYMLDCPNRPY